MRAGGLSANLIPPPALASSPRRRRNLALPVALLGGRGTEGFENHRGRDGSLYMPGGRGRAGRGRGDQPEFPSGGRGGLGIVDPSGRRLPTGGTPPPPGGGLVGSGLEIPGGTEAPTYNKYRPPAGFSFEQSTQWQELDANLKQMEANQLLDMLSTQSGYWHTLAKVIPLLNRSGFDTKLLEDISGIESRVQNLWMISGSVYDSLKLSGEFTDAELSYFDSMESGPEMLGEFRFVDSAERRIPSCKYIVRHKLNAEEAFKLARAVKDYERRKDEEKEGFLDTPADCMALKYFRDCVEQRKNESELERALKRGLACPELSQSAAEKLESFLIPAETESSSQQDGDEVAMPAFDYVRFTEDEIGYRPVGIAGTYGQVDASGIRQVSITKTSTEFSVFDETGAGHPWMVLPAWRAVTFAKLPFCIYIPECSEVAVLAKEDVSRKPSAKDGAGMVLVDKAAGSVEGTSWYICPSAAGPVELVPGHKAAAREILGRVLLIIKTLKRPQDLKEMPIQL